mmetsp:Transcript_17124/g.43550  ORF Transcript_17124/g.43550 Transcript_17124/m.43550 type:complete len:414 (+) Transcript_17124:130-1371(+)
MLALLAAAVALGAGQVVIPLYQHGEGPAFENNPKSLLQLNSRSKAAARLRGPIPAGKALDVLYGVVRVGNPPQEFTVAFDTASGNLVLPASECESMACQQHRMYQEMASVTSKTVKRLDSAPGGSDDGVEKIKVSFGTGSVTARIVEDVVCLGAKSAICDRADVLMAEHMDDYPFSIVPYDGVLGLGLTESSTAPAFNILGRLSEKMKNDRFAIWLATDVDKAAGDNSELSLGDWKNERTASEFMWTSLSRETGFWEVQLEDVWVGSDATELTLPTCTAGHCYAVLDSGTTLIAGPPGEIQAIKGALGVREDCSNLGELQNLAFKINGYVMSLEPQDYVLQDSTGCHAQLMELRMPKPKGPAFLLGQIFLRKFYTVFDRDSLKIGMAVAMHASAKPGESGTPPEKLFFPVSGD